MQISLKWIQELLDIETVKLDNLVEKLTLTGFEVEEIKAIEINKKKQIVLDVSATANRSDSLSIQGLSTEMATILDNSIQISPYLKKITSSFNSIDKLFKPILGDTNCSIFVSVIIENLTDITVPRWLKTKLISSGISPLNNLLDFAVISFLSIGLSGVPLTELA